MTDTEVLHVCVYIHTHTHTLVSGQHQATLQSAVSPFLQAILGSHQRAFCTSDQSFLVKRTSLPHSAVMKSTARHIRPNTNIPAHRYYNMDSDQDANTLTFEPPYYWLRVMSVIQGVDPSLKVYEEWNQALIDSTYHVCFILMSFMFSPVLNLISCLYRVSDNMRQIEGCLFFSSSSCW